MVSKKESKIKTPCPNYIEKMDHNPDFFIMANFIKISRLKWQEMHFFIKSAIFKISDKYGKTSGVKRKLFALQSEDKPLGKLS